MRQKTFCLFVFGMLVSVLITGPAFAAEVLTEEDFVEKTVVKEQLEKTADNFIILFDSSNSMNTPYKKGTRETKYEIAKQILKEKERMIPDLGYNAGLYLFTPFKEVYPMGPFDKDRFAEAIDSLPAEPKGPTFLTQALRQLDPVLAGLSGKTVVFIFSDGTISETPGMREPEDHTAELAQKYDVCFYMISYARRGVDNKRLEDMAKANECSRVVSFIPFMETPGYLSSALYVVKATEAIETTTETKIVGLKTENILFDFDRYDIRDDFRAELDELGMFLKGNPDTYAMVVGYADDTGPEEYNMMLSQRRAASVADYLVNNFGIDRDRLVLNWYGKANPIASNATSDGRAQNRRVEIAVGKL